MSDLSQLVSDPNLTAQLIDLHKFVGLTGAPVIEQAVQYLKEQWGLSTKLAPVAALLLGVFFNMALAVYLGLSLPDAVVLGAATGLLASGWHVVSH